MKTRKTSLLLSILIILFTVTPVAASADPPAGAPGPDVIAFVHAAIIPMDEERVLHDQTVVIADRSIVAIGPAAEIAIPEGAHIVDATGRYLLPAFCDMHVHLLGEAWNMMLPPEERLANEDMPWDRFLFPYVANGVTTVQELFGVPGHVALRERIARGEIVGPRLIVARMIDAPKKAWPPPLGVWVATPDEAREAVRQAKKDGYDKIKVYSFLDKESYDAIVSTAHELGMDVIGHIPMSLSIEYALDAGQTFIAHSEELAKHAGDGDRAKRIEEIADMMVEHGTWLAPTLITTESIIEVFDDPVRLVSRPEAAYYRHPMEQGVWSFVLENLYTRIPVEGQREIRDSFDQFQKPLVVAFQKRGGKMLAGSDTVLPGLVPGFALHRELQELVKAGLTPFEALRTATILPFEYLGESEVSGTVATGKRSDLVLLEDNPLDDISHTTKIAGVLTQGRWISAEKIAQKMEELTRETGAQGESGISENGPIRP